MDPRCRIEMLGPLRLVREGDTTQARFGSRKAAALLAYLALRLGPHAREQVIDTFWPDMDLPEGRNNLNNALSGLRRLLEPPGVPKGAVLAATHAQVGLNPATVSTDAAEFERLLRDGEQARALALYRGPFQPGNYQDWAVRESERLEVRRVAAMDALGEALEAQGRDAEASSVSEQRLAIDPYSETAQVGLIRRQVRAGRREAARESARRFKRLFQEEFGAGPGAGTLQAVEDLFARGLFAQPAAPAPATPAPQKAPAATPGPEPEKVAAPEARAALPFWLSRFFGREAEMTQLAGLLLPAKDARGADRPARLITLVGPGGVGKTRLAAEFARLAAGRFGLWCGFVPLADVSDPAQIPARIAQALRLAPSPAMTPLDQVVAFFAGREASTAPPALLILDNLEHLWGTEDEGEPPVAGVARTLLGATSGLVLLCTSRRSLGIGGERLLPLGPLPVPPNEASGTDLTALAQIPSVRLYVDRAQAIRPDFGLTPTNGPSVAALCRALEGSPLALELAASWVRQTPPRRMWERLEQGLGVPDGRQADLPDRHRSVSAALDWSWRLLSDPQRRLLARLSVFRGGWALEAAEAVCEEPDALGLLADLQEASLVFAREGGDGEVRYGLLETVRQYAWQRLAEEDCWKKV